MIDCIEGHTTEASNPAMIHVAVGAPAGKLLHARVAFQPPTMPLTYAQEPIAYHLGQYAVVTGLAAITYTAGFPASRLPLYPVPRRYMRELRESFADIAVTELLGPSQPATAISRGTFETGAGFVLPEDMGIWTSIFWLTSSVSAGMDALDTAAPDE